VAKFEEPDLCASSCTSWIPEEGVQAASKISFQEEEAEMFAVGHPSPAAPGSGGGTSGPPTSSQPPFKLSVPESLDRIKEEFGYLQAQTTK